MPIAWIVVGLAAFVTIILLVAAVGLWAAPTTDSGRAPSPPTTTAQTTDQQFLAYLGAHGVDTSKNPASLISLGHDSCTMMSVPAGLSGPDARSSMERVYTEPIYGFNWNPAIAHTMVVASATFYCPQYAGD
jgi:hypothetical protein